MMCFTYFIFFPVNDRNGFLLNPTLILPEDLDIMRTVVRMRNSLFDDPELKPIKALDFIIPWSTTRAHPLVRHTLFLFK